MVLSATTLEKRQIKSFAIPGYPDIGFGQLRDQVFDKGSVICGVSRGLFPNDLRGLVGCEGLPENPPQEVQIILEGESLLKILQGGNIHLGLSQPLIAPTEQVPPVSPEIRAFKIPKKYLHKSDVCRPGSLLRG